MKGDAQPLIKFFDGSDKRFIEIMIGKKKTANNYLVIC